MESYKYMNEDEYTWNLDFIGGAASKYPVKIANYIPVLATAELAEIFECEEHEVRENHRAELVLFENAVEDFFRYAEEHTGKVRGNRAMGVMLARARLIEACRCFGDVFGMSRFQVMGYVANIAHQIAELQRYWEALERTYADLY